MPKKALTILPCLGLPYVALRCPTLDSASPPFRFLPAPNLAYLPTCLTCLPLLPSHLYLYLSLVPANPAKVLNLCPLQS